MKGKGDGGFTGEDIFENSKLKYGLENVVLVERLPLRPTKLVVAVSEEVYPEVKTIDDFKEVVGDREVLFASEFPELARNTLKRLG